MMEPDGKTVELMNSVKDKIRDMMDRQEKAVLAARKQFSKEKKEMCEEQRALAKKVDMFWSRAFRNHPGLTKYISPEDSNILSSLEDFKVEEIDDDHGSFRLTFSFKDGDYTTKCDAVKKFEYNKDLDQFEVTAAEVAWKPGKAVAADRKRKRDDEGPGKASQPKSFSEWLVSETDRPKIGVTLRETIWPRAIEYFQKSVNDEDGGDDLDDDDDGDYDEEDDGPGMKMAPGMDDDDDDDDEDDDDEEGEGEDEDGGDEEYGEEDDDDEGDED